MIIGYLRASRTFLRVEGMSPIPAGAVGARIALAFDSSWEGLTPTAVFRGAVTKDVIPEGDTVLIPPEVLTEVGGRLFIGLYGASSTGMVAIPTLWAELGVICPGTDPSGDTTTDPTLPVWAQLHAEVSEKTAALTQRMDSQMGNLEALETAAKENLVAAINEAARTGGVAPAAVVEAVNNYLKENTIQVAADVFMRIREGQIQFSGDNVQWKDLIALSELEGRDGVGISAVTHTSDAQGNTVVTLTRTDGSTDTFTVKSGADGKTPVKGVDYATEEDKQELVDAVLAALPTAEGGSF